MSMSQFCKPIDLHHGSRSDLKVLKSTVPGSSAKHSPKEEEPKSVVAKEPSAENVADVADADVDKSPTQEASSSSIVTSSSSFFSSAWNKVGEITK